MTRTLALASLLLVASPAGASAQCELQFEVAASSGMPVPASRVTRMADIGTCTFDVRLQPTEGACAVGQLTVRGLNAASAAWERIGVRPRARRARRRVLRAHVEGRHGPGSKARLALRCAPRPALPGCSDVLAESAYCYLGGGHRVRVVGLDTGLVCRASPDDLTDPLRALLSRSLAVFEGDAYTCAGSAGGGFVATPLDGGASRVVAGRCEAATTDGASLLVLPAPGFDAAPARETARQLGIRRRAAAGTSLTEIRAYAFPEAVPAGPYEVAFDLADIPPDSPCRGLHPEVMAAADGAVYLTGCRPDASGGCAPMPGVCVLGSAGGAFADSAGGAFVRLLELEDFAGRIQGMSALDGGRLVVLAASTTQLPPVGYDDPSVGALSRSPCVDCGGSGFGFEDAMHVFDTLTGARLDSLAIGTSAASGLSCETGGS